MKCRKIENSPHGHPLAVLERSNTTRVHSLKLFRKKCRTSQRLYFFSIRVTDQGNNLSDSRVTTTSSESCQTNWI
jgi:hypothetical protein